MQKVLRTAMVTLVAVTFVGSLTGCDLVEHFHGQDHSATAAQTDPATPNQRKPGHEPSVLRGLLKDLHP